MPFRKGIRGDIAAACRVSQFWLDRDSANANYSSMRMDQLLTKRQHAMLKVMLGRTAAGQVYEAVLPWILILLGEKIPANPRARAKLFSYETRPDQPEYVDPEKDIAASVNAIVNNLSSYDIELSARGKDRDRLFLEIAREKKQMEQLGLSWPLPQTKAAPASHTAGQAPAPVAPSNTEAEAANV
jgi:capsid protein